MRAENFGLIAGLALLAGCASTDVAQKDTLNEPSDRMAALEDHRPPNPNRPNDTRELKAIPTVVQHDPALDKPKPDQHENKGLVVNAGQDQLVRTQDPTTADNAPVAKGGPATPAQTATVVKADSELATKVKDAISKMRNPGANVDTQAKTESQATSSSPTNGEAKAIDTFEVTAKNGEVTLSGSVDSETQRTGFEQAASRVQGVKSVNNYLTVSKSEKQ
jgi:hypothetical protein